MIAAPRLAFRRRAAVRAIATFRDSYGLWIDGREVQAEGGIRLPVENPANREIITHVQAAQASDVGLAVEAGRRAFDDGVWSKADVRDRATVLNEAARLLRQRVPEFAAKEVVQTGRAIREMNAQLGRLPEWLEYFAALARVHEGTVPPFKGPYVNYVRRVPLGVVGQITPWNHPMLIALKKIAPALATGNSVVVKPSELAPVTLLEFGALCKEAGLPDGVLNVVPGLGAEAGRALSESPGIKKIDLTGGTETGRVVAANAGRNLASSVMELGGKAPMLVFEDADVEAAVNGAAFASFIASGQTCVMGARLLVHESVYEDVVSAFVAKAAHIQMGDPEDNRTQMGPVISGAHRDKIAAHVDGARDEGARVLCGGYVPEEGPLGCGYYYPPTVIGSVTRSMRIFQEEVFGPVVVVHAFSSEEEAVELANDSPFGLAAAVWTRDVKRAHRVADRLDVGLCWVNDHHRNDPSSPWGGTKDSGMGRENGVDALHEYTQSKSVIVGYQDEPFDWFSQGEARYG